MGSLPVSRLIVPICLLCLALWITGCEEEDGGSSERPVETVTEVRSPLERNRFPDPAPSELEMLVSGNTDFAVDLFQELGQPDRNLFFSPYSISLGLAMAYAGAEGDTRFGMAGALHYNLFGETLHTAFNRLDLILEERQNVNTGIVPPPLLYMANALWAPPDPTFLPGYLDTLAVHYGAGVHLADFEAAPEAAGEAINRWVSDRTEGLIPHLLDSGTISAHTRLVLVNALYFQAYWHLPFDPDSTRDAPFFLPDGEENTVALMTRKERYGYDQGTDYQAVALPYAGEDLAMVILLPEPGRRISFEEGLTGRQVRAICDSLVPELVRVYLPRFTLTPEAIRLDAPLSRMGMAGAFTESADFSGMDGRRDLFITNVTHKSFVSVDEFGTEASAATGVIVGPTSGTPLYTVRADRPFLFLIRDMETGTVLFMGRVADPGP